MLDRPAVRAAAIDAAVLVTLTVATAGVYIWTNAPLYNPFNTIDAWLYTALWTNFDQIYESFSRTYYISRVPWIVPGYLLNAVFDAHTAAILLHTAYFLGGGVLFYVLCRRWLGVVAAAIGYVALIGTQMYYNAHRWDYQEGAVLTYMIAAYAFSLPRTHAPRQRAACFALGGAFAAALVTTRIVDGAYLLGLPLLYVAVTPGVPRSARWSQFARDVSAFAAGAVALLVMCGLWAKAHGEEFLFFMPQVRVVRSTSGGYNQIPVDLWLPSAPYFWVPIFVAVFGAVVLAVAPRRDQLAWRFLAGAVLWLATTYFALSLWQFLGDGWLLNTVYYFSSFLVPTIVCLTATVRVLLGAELSRGSLLVGGLCTAGILGPLIWIYGSDDPVRTAGGYADASYIAMFVAMGFALLLAGIVLVPRFRAIGAVAAAVAAFAFAYGLDASHATYLTGASDPRAGGLYEVGQELVRHLRKNGYENKLPHIWYDETEDAGALRSIQSLYYYAFTFMDVAMPAINDTFRSRMAMWRPEEIVLLCVDPGCSGAERALDGAGFRPKRRSQTLLASDGVRVWVKIYGIIPGTG